MLSPEGIVGISSVIIFFLCFYEAEGKARTKPCKFIVQDSARTMCLHNDNSFSERQRSTQAILEENGIGLFP